MRPLSMIYHFLYQLAYTVATKYSSNRIRYQLSNTSPKMNLYNTSINYQPRVLALS